MHKVTFTISYFVDNNNTSIAEEDASDLADVLYADVYMYGMPHDITYTVERVTEPLPDYLMVDNEEEDDYELDPYAYYEEPDIICDDEEVDITDEDGV
jgi:hypothetical protein